MSKTSENQYYLNIHHRSIAINIEQGSQAMEQSSSPGHFYVSLQKNEEKQFFGKYAQGNGLIQQLFSKELIDSNAEEIRTIELEKLKEQTGGVYHSYKSIIITEEQYDRALDYALSKTDGRIEPGNYIIAINDCTDFVQQVYNQAGLPLYFTTAYTRTELSTMGSAAALKVLIKYGASDCMDLTFSAIEATSKEALARRLNIDIDKISLNSPDIDLNVPLNMLPSFRVSTDQINMPNIINLEHDAQEFMATNARQESKEEAKFDIPEIMHSFILTEDQRHQAMNDANDFFASAMQNPYMASSTAYNYTASFPDINQGPQDWADSIASMSHSIFGNIGIQQPSNPNQYEQFYNGIQKSTELIGKVFDNLQLNDEDSLD